MSKNTNIQSVEPNIADLVNGWLKSYIKDVVLYSDQKIKAAKNVIEAKDSEV